MAKLSHKRTVLNNAVAHSPFALDKVLDQFLTLGLTFFATTCFLLFQPANQKARAQWRKQGGRTWNLGTLPISSYIVSSDN